MLRFLAAAIFFGLVFRAVRGLLRLAGGAQDPNRVRHTSRGSAPSGAPKKATPPVRREDVIDVPYEDVP